MTKPVDRQVERVEPGAVALSRLPDADYVDAFRVESESGRTGEQWARRMFESGARLVRRVFGVAVWQGVLGFRLVPPDTPGHIAGWVVSENEPGLLVMRADSRLMEGAMVIEVSQDEVIWTTLLRFDDPAARPIWAVAGNGHRALAPVVLGRAARR